MLFLVIAPLAVLLGLLASRTTSLQREMMAWFGIRGVGSLYYLMHAIQHGLPLDLAGPLTSFTFTEVVVSVAVHGISVTPMMEFYRRKRGAASQASDRP